MPANRQPTCCVPPRSGMVTTCGPMRPGPTWRRISRARAGFVQDTLPGNDSTSIALLRLDTNLYESTKAEMEYLWPKLAPGGVFLIDDYFRWLGQKKAIDEYLAAHGVHMLLARLDDHSAMGIKPA